MSDLVEFLRARLAEDEEVARQSADFGGGINGYHWRVSGSHEDEGGTYWRITATAVASGHEQAIEVVGNGMSGGGVHTEQVAHHAVRHDPARVLCEVEAKRRILDLHEPAEENYGDGFIAERCMVCDPQDPEPYPCATLRLLAAVYATHLDYRPDWAPSA